MSARRGLLSLWGGQKPTLPAVTEPARVPSLPQPMTARDVKKLARQAATDRPRLVVGFDATISRQAAWDAFSKPLHDKVLRALPGELLVALAVHGGNRVHTFTPFVADAGELRDRAAGVTCRAGQTRLIEILERVARMREGVGVVLYIGDAFEEDERDARRIADVLARRQTRVIILHDGPPPAAFGEIVDRTAGALLPFDTSALDALGALLEAVAVLAVGDVELLETKQATMPAATLLLEHLSDRKFSTRRARR